jgi:hypothetical protein
MKEQGSVLLMTLFVMMLLLFLGGVLTRLAGTELEISGKFSDGIAAFYAAEAGVKRALVEVDNHTIQNNFTEILESGSYDVTIKDGSSKNTKVITAVGKKNGAVRKAVAYVFLPETIELACFSGEKMVLSAMVIGTVGLRGAEITINDGGGIVDLAGNTAQPIKNSSFKLPPIKITYNEKIYEHARRLPNIFSNQTYNLKGTYFVDGDFVMQDAVIDVPEYSSATIFVKGKAELSGNIGSNVTIISTDMVTLKGTGGNSERKLYIYAKKSIQVCNSMEGQVLLVSKGDIRINGTVHGIAISKGSAFIESPVEGSVLADKMVMQSSSGEVTYDEHIFPSLGLTRPQITTWDY